MNIFDLTAHQLDVIRTFASVVGGVGGFLGGVSAIFAFLARRWAKRAFDNTATQDWKDGVLVTTPMAEGVRHARIASEAARQEIGDLAGWVKGTGRRRLPTTEVPRPEESTYE